MASTQHLGELAEFFWHIGLHWMSFLDFWCVTGRFDGVVPSGSHRFKSLPHARKLVSRWVTPCIEQYADDVGESCYGGGTRVPGLHSPCLFHFVNCNFDDWRCALSPHPDQSMVRAHALESPWQMKIPSPLPFFRMQPLSSTSTTSNFLLARKKYEKTLKARTQSVFGFADAYKEDSKESNDLIAAFDAAQIAASPVLGGGSGDGDAVDRAKLGEAEQALRAAYHESIVYSGNRCQGCLASGKLTRSEVVSGVCATASEYVPAIE